jgi:hypothetical protein
MFKKHIFNKEFFPKLKVLRKIYLKRLSLHWCPVCLRVAPRSRHPIHHCPHIYSQPLWLAEKFHWLVAIWMRTDNLIDHKLTIGVTFITARTHIIIEKRSWHCPSWHKQCPKEPSFFLYNSQMSGHVKSRARLFAFVLQDHRCSCAGLYDRSLCIIIAWWPNSADETTVRDMWHAGRAAPSYRLLCMTKYQERLDCTRICAYKVALV